MHSHMYFSSNAGERVQHLLCHTPDKIHTITSCTQKTGFLYIGVALMMLLA